METLGCRTEDQVSETAVRQAFLTQRDFCAAIGAPVTTRVCEALAGALDRTTASGQRVLDWAGHPIDDALPLRLVGGLNAARLRGDGDAVCAFATDTSLAETVAALRRLIAREDAAILPWLDGPPQTNEAGRSAALMLGLMAVTRAFGQPIELLEIGSSAGLNLLIKRFAFDLGRSAVPVGRDRDRGGRRANPHAAQIKREPVDQQVQPRARSDL